ncbi:MAG: single-stranded DNA-binding protein [Treponema sp.]|nr:single-stranded DNA-binding protein [Treponema sp.]
MNQLNSVIVEGNVTKQPVSKEPVPGFKVADFTIGVNRYSKDKNGNWKEEVSFIPVHVQNKMADYAVEKAVKGRGVRVVGRLKQERWKTAEDKWESRMLVVAEHIEYKPVKVEGEAESGKSVEEEIRMAEAATASAEELAEAAAF